VVNAQRFKVDLAEFPRVVRIFDRCMKLPAFERAHPKNHPAGG
jgi:maleylpyruvate isomerase